MSGGQACVAAVSDVSTSFNGHEVLRGVSLVVGPRDVILVEGPSGAGKTTLVHLLAGLVEPTRGRLIVGDTVSKWMLGRALVPQGIALIDELTVAENVELERLTLGLPDQGLFAGCYEQLHIGHLKDRRSSEVSVGERQRVMVARALASLSPLILADEPTAHQDSRHGERVVEALASASSQDRAVVVVSRSGGEFRRIATRRATLLNGQVRFD